MLTEHYNKPYFCTGSAPIRTVTRLADAEVDAFVHGRNGVLPILNRLCHDGMADESI